MPNAKQGKHIRGHQVVWMLRHNSDDDKYELEAICNINGTEGKIKIGFKEDSLAQEALAKADMASSQAIFEKVAEFASS